MLRQVENFEDSKKVLLFFSPSVLLLMVLVGNGFQQVNRGEGQDGSQDVVVLGQASMEKSILRLCSPQVVFRSESSKLVLRFRSLSRTMRKNFPLMMNSSPPHSPSILSSRSLRAGNCYSQHCGKDWVKIPHQSA